eukprot:3184240-Karenia_brevis.AAC.1
MLAAASPEALDKAIDVMLGILTRVYKILRLEINWKPGKTESFIQYRGKKAVQRLESRRIGPENSLAIKVPGHDGVLINVVPNYRHLGGIIEADNS